MNFVVDHPLLDTVALYVAFGLIGTMPAKGTHWTAETLYDWFYDFAHVVMNFVPPSRRPPGFDANPTQPAEPAQPPKE